MIINNNTSKKSSLHASGSTTLNGNVVCDGIAIIGSNAFYQPWNTDALNIANT
jgi:hypothetical protein